MEGGNKETEGRIGDHVEEPKRRVQDLTSGPFHSLPFRLARTERPVGAVLSTRTREKWNSTALRV